MDGFTLDSLQTARQVLAWSGLIFFMILEQWRPFARRGEPAWRHYLRNVALAGLNVAGLALVWRGLLLTAATWADGSGWGVLNWLGLGWPWRVAATVLAFDALSWGMHVLYHEVPVMWRLHQVHHTDLDFDVSTASRFHFGEILLSTAVQTLVALGLGAPPEGIVLFQLLLLLQAQAQHSNLALPARLDGIVTRVLVTPNMHRIHHSTVMQECNSNYATILSVWDRLGGTFRWRPQAGILIGLTQFPRREELGWVSLLLLPFRRLRPAPPPAGG
jgi:sterol desaturase/sphingolipid hydroxylase (fatty acid hydroxylase superfamily)